MPVNRQRAVVKTALLAPGGTLLTWGVQMLIDGDPLTGGIGVLIGTLFVAGFVVAEEYDIPYEDEIIALVGSQDPDTIADAGKQAAENISEDVDGGN